MYETFLQQSMTEINDGLQGNRYHYTGLYWRAVHGNWKHEILNTGPNTQYVSQPEWLRPLSPYQGACRKV